MQEELMDAILYLEKLKMTNSTTEEWLTEQKDVIKEAATKE
jgi:hypothetical protein